MLDNGTSRNHTKRLCYLAIILSILFLVGLLLPAYKVEIVPVAHGEEVSPMVKELLAVAWCESGLRHYLPDGSVIVSKTHDVGVFQINLAAHGEELKQLNLDPYDFEDNVHYAVILYLRNGLRDWSMSRGCWGKNIRSDIALN